MNKSEKFELLGLELEWKLTDTDTGNRYCVLEATVPPGVMVPPHRHPDHEAFLVLEGAPEFATESNGIEWCFAVPGEMINAPSMSLHGLRNPTVSDVRLIITCTPNLGRFYEDAGLPFHTESPHRSRVPSRHQVERVLQIGERYGHVYSAEEPGECRHNPSRFAIKHLLTHPTVSSINKAYLF